ncbi:MAG TPA: hypothetical protein VGN64_04670 [Dyadobacter sp.]|jgi:mRNA-degrading endonuclease RelE of RelBE toxin-antitoxin system|nr:hypothetical protein [Dyadobacter sp.]
MSYKVLASENFVKELKRLSKKYHSIKDDVANLGDDLSLNPKLGVFIGKDCYKVRLAIKSKGKDKSGGARVITFVFAVKEEVVLLSVYDKSGSENISDQELNFLEI